MSFLQKLQQQLVEIWQGMSRKRRILLAALTVLSVVTLFAVGYWTLQSDYQVLYSQLAPEDAGAITTALQSRNISYRLEANGTSILVPAEDLSSARISLAMDGLPAKSGKGFEYLDEDSSLSTSPFRQHVNFVRALQGELARTIMSLEPITYARVHIVLPKPTVFREKKPATASVLIRLKPGVTLDRRTSAGITYVVAHAVEGLKPENVSLLDATGRLLPGAPDDKLGPVTRQLEYQEFIENYLASKVQDLLDQHLGAGRAVVKVSAAINFSRRKQEEVSFDPEKKTPEWMIESGTELKNAEGVPQGPAGAASNLPDSPAGIARAQEKNEQQETSQVRYAVSKVMKWAEEAVGTVEYLSVAAVVDLSSSDDSGESAATKLSLPDIEKLIKDSIGFQEAKGSITVREGQLLGGKELLPGEDEISAMKRWQSILSLVRSGAIGLLAVVLFFMGWMLLRRWRNKPTEREAGGGEVEESISRRITALAQENPDVLAQVLSSWLEQPEDGEKEKAA